MGGCGVWFVCSNFRVHFIDSRRSAYKRGFDVLWTRQGEPWSGFAKGHDLFRPPHLRASRAAVIKVQCKHKIDRRMGENLGRSKSREPVVNTAGRRSRRRANWSDFFGIQELGAAKRSFDKATRHLTEKAFAELTVKRRFVKGGTTGETCLVAELVLDARWIYRGSSSRRFCCGQSKPRPSKVVRQKVNDSFTLKEGDVIGSA